MVIIFYFPLSLIEKLWHIVIVFFVLLSFIYPMMKKLVQFIFEALHLKHIKHEWWRMAWVQFPDSVAEHSLNAAQIGYILAKMEGVDANKVAAMLVRHDIAETRIGDIHKVGTKYITNKKEIETKVLHDQVDHLEFGNNIFELFDEYEERKTLEWIIAKDADYLEQAFQAKVYQEQGHEACENWIENVGKALKTASAKQLWKQMQEGRSSDWWREKREKNEE